MRIKEKQQRGEETTPADIFAVQLALNPEVGQALSQAGKKAFAEMKPEEQDKLLKQDFPDIYLANQQMADSINRDGMRPQQLVFGEIRGKVKEEEIVAPGNPDLPPNALPVEPMPIEASGAKEAVKALEVPFPERPLERQEQPFEHYLPTDVPMTHVERYAPEGGKETQSDFASRVQSARNAKSEQEMSASR